MPRMAVGFFDTFFDSDYRQRSDINDVQMDAAEARAMVAETSAVLGAQLAAQRDQIRDLSMLTSVLARMLIEGGIVDEKILRYRVEAELESHAERIAAKASTAGSEPAPVDEPPPTTPTTCVRCGVTVPANLTVITADGTVCDRCGAGR